VSVAVISWCAISVVGDTELRLGTGSDTQIIGGLQVAATALVAVLAAWALLALIERRLGPGRRTLLIWRRIAVVAALVSLAGPLTADAPASVQWSLVALHSCTAAAFIASMTARSHRFPCR
jgi:hypothetical protein